MPKTKKKLPDEKHNSNGLVAVMPGGRTHSSDLHTGIPIGAHIGIQLPTLRHHALRSPHPSANTARPLPANFMYYLSNHKVNYSRK